MENARWKTQRQCVTSSKIRPQYFQRYKALGDGPIYFSFAVAIYLNWSKVNLQEKLSLYQVIFGRHTLTHSKVLRRLPLYLSMIFALTQTEHSFKWIWAWPSSASTCLLFSIRWVGGLRSLMENSMNIFLNPSLWHILHEQMVRVSVLLVLVVTGENNVKS